MGSVNPSSTIEHFWVIPSISNHFLWLCLMPISYLHIVCGTMTKYEFFLFFILIKIQIYSENHPNSCNTFWRANDHDRSMNMQFFFVFSVCFFSNQHQGFLLIKTPLLGKYVEIKMLVVTNVENRMYMYKKKKKNPRVFL